MKRIPIRVLSLLLLLTLALAPAAAPGEAVFSVDAEAGAWRYRDEHLSVTVDRYAEEKLVYFVCDVRASAESPLRTLLSPGKKPGRGLVNPLALAEEHGAVLALTDDFSGKRLGGKKPAGIVIRHGQALSKKTVSSKKYRSWPNLDTLAVYADGSMKAGASDVCTAAEFLEAGAEEVFAFGPVLVSDGEVNPVVLDPKYYPYGEPRLAIGMIEPYHYIVLCAEGRTDRSRGARCSWMAEKMAALGCVEALNLDGGGTCALIFMGEVLNRSPRNMRSVNSLIAFGGE